ncbi:MAG: TIM-barrel domain-containing protein [Novosphingobium sp.]
MKYVIGMAAISFLAMSPVTAKAEDLTMDAPAGHVSVSPVSDGVVRIRISAAGESARDESWAVPASVRAARTPATVSENTLTTNRMTVAVDPQTLAITVTDRSGHVMVTDAPRPLQRTAGGFTFYKSLGRDEHVFAFGDKTGGLDRRGKSFVNWNTDAYGFTSSEDPIYKSVPFYISAGGPGGAYGLFLDNTFRSWFDFGHRRDDEIAIGADGGAIDYYLIAGPSVADVVKRYAALTGPAPMPPRWVLGYQQSRWSYMNEGEVRTLAARLRDERVPTDVIWLDIDFQDRNRPFTIDRQAFPNFRGMVADLNAMGIKTVAITDLHTAKAPGQGYAPYDQGIAGDHFLKGPDGQVWSGEVWPGPAVFPDFTRAQTREWYGTLFAPLLADGVAGIWNDMNEPAIFKSPNKSMPLDVVHRIEGDGFETRTATHREMHNVYGMENTRATYEGLRRLRPDERAFVMTRASYAGGQRYAATWTGDNTSSWDHLKLAVSQTLNLGLSGFVWTGTDVGGFTGGPSPDLMTRWFEYSAFLPVFRDHSQKGMPRAEPWVDGPEQLAIRRRYVEERYRLLPFLYQLAATSAQTGEPLARPVFYDFPAALRSTCDMAMHFTLGGKLLIAGAPKGESPASYKMCLPQGVWYDYWTGQPVAMPADQTEGIAEIDRQPRLDTLPVFVRGGAVIPRQPLVQSTSEAPQGPLQLDIYPADGCAGALYDDDGHSMGFARGQFFRQTVSCRGQGDSLSSIVFSPREGGFTPWWKELRIVIHGSHSYRARVGGKALVPDASGAFVIPANPKALRVDLQPL